MDVTEKNVTPAAKLENALSVSEEERKEKEGKERMEQLRDYHVHFVLSGKGILEMDGKIYEIETSIQEDDENETEFDFIFRKPGTPSYDRYVKTSGTSGTKALRTFVLDNICEEQRDELKSTLEEYPAMAISLGEKLLNMLGLSKDTTVKKL